MSDTVLTRGMRWFKALAGDTSTAAKTTNVSSWLTSWTTASQSRARRCETPVRGYSLMPKMTSCSISQGTARAGVATGPIFFSADGACPRGHDGLARPGFDCVGLRSTWLGKLRQVCCGTIAAGAGALCAQVACAPSGVASVGSSSAPVPG